MNSDPEKNIQKLEKDLKELKAKYMNNKKTDSFATEGQDSAHLRQSMMDLSKSINSLLGVFKEAAEDLKLDTHDAVLVSEKLDGIITRLEKVEIQNEKIAKGIVAVADILEELETKITEENNKPKIQNTTKNMQNPFKSFAQKPSFQSNYQQNMDNNANTTQPTQPKPLPSYNNMIPNQEKNQEEKKKFLNSKM